MLHSDKNGKTSTEGSKKKKSLRSETKNNNNRNLRCRSQATIQRKGSDKNKQAPQRATPFLKVMRERKKVTNMGQQARIISLWRGIQTIHLPFHQLIEKDCQHWKDRQEAMPIKKEGVFNRAIWEHKKHITSSTQKFFF